MDYKPGNADELKTKFWKALNHSPFVMLALDAYDDSTAPMTAQLNKDANSAIWFFTARNGKYARLGAATAVFSAKDHQLFARFNGTLVEEPSRERVEQFWSNIIAAWFPGGKYDPNLLLMRMDLGTAKIWDSELGLIGTAKMLFGMDARKDAHDNVTETTL